MSALEESQLSTVTSTPAEERPPPRVVVGRTSRDVISARRGAIQPLPTSLCATAVPVSTPGFGAPPALSASCQPGC